MNSEKEDIGVLKDYTFDLAFGSDENDFECVVNINNNVCEAGYYLYYEGSEYGGIIDKVSIDTEQEQVTYTGRTWHGLLESKILQPDEGSDYLTLSGEANSVIGSLITRMGIGGLFKVSTESSGVNVSAYKMNRYIGGYKGIMKMLKANGGKLNIFFKRGFVELSAIPFVDYSKDEQFDTDQISFSIEKRCNQINHVICLGRGELKDRKVIHLFVDALGNVSGKQTLTGLDEVCSVYDNSNAESDDELINGGLDIIKQSWAENSIEFSFDSNDASYDVNDIIGAKELTTGLMVSSSISKKIVKIEDNATSISYECEDTTGTVASSGYPTSGSGGGAIDIDDELSSTSTNPVQNKVITSKLETVTTKQITLSCLSSPINLVKIGRLVQFIYPNDTAASVAIGNLGTVGTLPDDFQPYKITQFVNFPLGATKIQLTFSANGTITAYNYSGNAITQKTTCRYGGCYISKI